MIQKWRRKTRWLEIVLAGMCRTNCDIDVDEIFGQMSVSWWRKEKLIVGKWVAICLESLSEQLKNYGQLCTVIRMSMTYLVKNDLLNMFEKI